MIHLPSGQPAPYGMVPLADEFAGPISQGSDENPRTMLLVQVAGADELAIWLGEIKKAEAEAQKGERLSGLEVVMATFEGKRYLSLAEITTVLASWLGMPYQGTETLILEGLDDHESFPLRGMSPQLKVVLQQVTGQENVRMALLGGVPHMIRLDWLQEMGPHDLERTGKSVHAYFEEHGEGQQEGTFSHLPIEEFTDGTIPVVRIVELRGSAKGSDTGNHRNMPVALLDLSQRPDIDLRTLSQLGVFERGAATDFAWALAEQPDDILVRLTCTYHAPAPGQFALLFSFLQHNAYLRWVLEHDNRVSLANATWMEQQESSVPQVLLSAENDELAASLRMALMHQTLTSLDRPPPRRKWCESSHAGDARWLGLRVALMNVHRVLKPFTGNDDTC